MKELALTFAVIALAIGSSFLATIALGDRELMTSPPEATAETFTRSLLEERYAQAKPFVDEDAASDPIADCRTPTFDMRHAFEVEAETTSSDQTNATVRVTASTRHRHTALAIDLSWRTTDWKVSRCTGAVVAR